MKNTEHPWENYYNVIIYTCAKRERSQYNFSLKLLLKITVIPVTVAYEMSKDGIKVTQPYRIFNTNRTITKYIT
jgi:hypothetical protein